MTTILASMPFDDVIVWDNSQRENLSCFGRFAAAAEAKNEWVYVQDDDLLAPIPALVRAHWSHVEAGGTGIVTNLRPDEEWRLTGIGSIFHRDTLEVLDRYRDRFGGGPEFNRVADVVHAYQVPFHRYWFGYLDFPWQTAPNRMYLEEQHYVVRRAAKRRCGELCPGEQDSGVYETLSGSSENLSQ